MLEHKLPLLIPISSWGLWPRDIIASGRLTSVYVFLPLVLEHYWQPLFKKPLFLAAQDAIDSEPTA